MSTRKPLTWFAPWGWACRPVAPAGWLLVIIGGLFLLQLLAEAWIAYRSLSAIIFVTFPYIVSTAAVVLWVGSKTGGNR